VTSAYNASSGGDGTYDPGLSESPLMSSLQRVRHLNSSSPRFMAILSFFAALVVSCAATNAQTALPTNQIEKIDRYVATRVAEQRIPGAALAIVAQDHITRVTGFGVADPSGRPVTAETPFILGSLSKSFTALAVMQLVEKGQINLDAKVREYIPWFTLADDSSREITVRQLLNQASGLSVETSEKFAASSDVSDSALENRVRSLRTEHLDRAVGSNFEYSGTNYAVLGLLVQIVSNQSYEKYIQEHIFTPLEMEHTYSSQVEAEKNGLASGYLYWFFFPHATELPFNRGSLPQGYIISTAHDMSHYLIAQLNGGRYGDVQILSAAGIREMHRPAIATWKRGTSYAMGWEIGPVAGIPAIWHEGSIFNYHANMVLIPGNGSGFILLENIYSGPDEGRLNQIADGVALLLTGKDPPPIASTARLKLAYGILLLIFFVQVWIIVHVVRRLTSRHARPSVRPTVWGVSMLVLAILLSLNWGLLIVFGIPRLFGMPLITTVVRVPDFGYVLLMCAFLAFSTSILKGLVGLSFFPNLRQVPGHLPSSH
jgi:CubicO group peptidase (beta-lactamase class C family)